MFGTTLALSLLLAVVAPLFLVAPGVARTSPFVVLVIGNLLPLIMVLIPLSIGVAMLRSGLFDIDVVINRALVYGPLTAMLVFVYLGGVDSHNVAAPTAVACDILQRRCARYAR